MISGVSLLVTQRAGDGSHQISWILARHLYADGVALQLRGRARCIRLLLCLLWLPCCPRMLRCALLGQLLCGFRGLRALRMLRPLLCGAVCRSVRPHLEGIMALFLCRSLRRRSLLGLRCLFRPPAPKGQVLCG